MQTGFRGRTAIFEIMIVDDEIKRLVLKTSDANQINELALKQGMITLQKDGIDKVLAGADDHGRSAAGHPLPQSQG